MKTIEFKYGQHQDFDPELIYFLDKEKVDFLEYYHRYRKQPLDGYGIWILGPASEKENLTYVEPDYQLLREIVKNGNYTTYNDEKIILKDKELNKIISTTLKVLVIISVLLVFLVIVRFVGFTFFSKGTNGEITKIEVIMQSNIKIARWLKVNYEYHVNDKIYKGKTKVDLMCNEFKYKVGDNIYINYVSFAKGISKYKQNFY